MNQRRGRAWIAGFLLLLGDARCCAADGKPIAGVVQDAQSGEAISGATVFALAPKDGRGRHEIVSSAETAADGRFTLAVSGPAPCHVVAWRERRMEVYASARLDPKALTEDLTLRMPRGHSVALRFVKTEDGGSLAREPVWYIQDGSHRETWPYELDDETEWATRDAVEVSSHQYRRADWRRTRPFAVTDENGALVLTGMEPMPWADDPDRITYEFWICCGTPLVGRQSVEVSLDRGDLREVAISRPDRWPMKLTGCITAADGVPLAGARVYLRWGGIVSGCSSGRWLVAVSLESGQIVGSFDLVATAGADRMAFLVERPGYYQCRIEFPLNPEAGTVQLTCGLSEGGTMTGRVLAANGDPVCAAEIRAEERSAEQEGADDAHAIPPDEESTVTLNELDKTTPKTDGNGEFQLERLPPGAISLWVRNGRNWYGPYEYRWGSGDMTITLPP